MGIVTGVFQFANGSPVANALVQWKLSQDAILFSASAACVVPRVVVGQTDANGNMTSTFAFNDVLSTTSGVTTFYQLTIKIPGSGGGQVWNENYYLTGTAANLNVIAPGGSGTVSGGSLIGDLWQANGDIISLGTFGILLWGQTASAGGAITLGPSPNCVEISDQNGNSLFINAGGKVFLLENSAGQAGIVNTATNTCYVVGNPLQVGVKTTAGGNFPATLASGLYMTTSSTAVIGTFTLTGGVPTVAANQLGLGFGTAATASNGTIVAPGSVAGYLTINLGGTNFKVPYYNN